MNVSVSLTVFATVVVFTTVRCSECHRLLMSVPGTPVVEVRTVAGPSQRGRAIPCRCGTLQEVIEHAG